MCVYVCVNTEIIIIIIIKEIPSFFSHLNFKSQKNHSKEVAPLDQNPEFGNKRGYKCLTHYLITVINMALMHNLFFSHNTKNFMKKKKRRKKC